MTDRENVTDLATAVETERESAAENETATENGFEIARERRREAGTGDRGKSVKPVYSFLFCR